MEVNTKKNRYIIALDTIEARSLVWNFFAENTGVDITKGATILKSDEPFDVGRKALAIQFINEVNENCPDLIKKMKSEVSDYGDY